MRTQLGAYKRALWVGSCRAKFKLPRERTTLFLAAASFSRAPVVDLSGSAAAPLKRSCGTSAAASSRSRVSVFRCSLPRPQSLGVSGQAFPSSAAALFGSAKLSGAAPPPGIPPAAHHLMFTRGGGDLDSHGDMIHQESAAAHAATSGTGGAAGMQTWVGLEGAPRGQQPMFLGGPAGLDAMGLDGERMWPLFLRAASRENCGFSVRHVETAG